MVIDYRPGGILQVFIELEIEPEADASKRERGYEMLIEGQFTLQAPIQKVWDSLLDPKTLGTCVPGTEKMEAIDDETYESIVTQRVGPFKVKLKFKTKLTEVRPPNYIKAVGRGADVTKLGNFSTRNGG